MKIAIDLPEEKDCRKCCCCIETKSLINNQEISFYACRAFKRILTQSVKKGYVAFVARCEECREAEIPEL